MMVSIFPAVGALVSALFMLIYPLKENLLKTIEHDLAERRAAKSNSEPPVS